MRLKNKEITNREKIHRFIESCSTVRLGFIFEDKPYIVPVNFVYQEGTVFLHCAFEGRKYACIQSGGNTCLEFDKTHGIDMQRASTFYTSVIAWGIPRILESMDEKVRILELLCEKYLGEKKEITDTMADGTCVVAFRLDTVTGKENRG